MTKPRKRNKSDYSDAGETITGPAEPSPAPTSGGRLPAPQADTSWERIQMSLRLRFNPIRNLKPAELTNLLDQWRLGFFRQTALVWDAMERRDTRLQTVAPKRKKSVARLGWEILTIDDSPEAMRQKRVLEYFYNHLTATTALEPDEHGGMALLVRQMMDAVGKRYAVHEITWQPAPGGAGEPSLTARFTFCPLWWFEGTRGKLRYLRNEMAIYGEDMQPWGWMVTVGEGLMEACSVAFVFKHTPLGNWVSFCEKFGIPGVIGQTDAAEDSPEWKALEDALDKFSSDWSAILRTGTITPVETKTLADQPFKPLVDMMDEEMTRLWRGSDLSTSSKMHALGATLQRDENQILEQDDAQMINETLDAQVSRFVLQYHFGDAPALAYLKIKTPEPPKIAQDIAVDQFLLAAGAPLSVRDALQRYGRTTPDADDALLHPPATPVKIPSAAVQAVEDGDAPAGSGN
jgi:phage gp29-like protein